MALGSRGRNSWCSSTTDQVRDLGPRPSLSLVFFICEILNYLKSAHLFHREVLRLQCDVHYKLSGLKLNSTHSAYVSPRL